MTKSAHFLVEGVDFGLGIEQSKMLVAPLLRQCCDLKNIQNATCSHSANGEYFGDGDKVSHLQSMQNPNDNVLHPLFQPVSGRLNGKSAH